MFVWWIHYSACEWCPRQFNLTSYSDQSKYPTYRVCVRVSNRPVFSYTMKLSVGQSSFIDDQRHQQDWMRWRAATACMVGPAAGQCDWLTCCRCRCVRWQWSLLMRAAWLLSGDDRISCSEHDIQGGPRNLAQFLYALTLSIIDRFTKLFYCENKKKIAIIPSL